MASHDATNRLDPAPTRALALDLRDVILGGVAFQQVRAARLGLGSTDLTALGHIYLAGPLTPGDLAVRLGLTSGSVTPLVDRIQAAGFVIRDTNPDDRRSSLVKTTPAGNSTMKEFYDELDDVVRSAVAAPPVVADSTMGEVFLKTANALKAHVAR